MALIKTKPTSPGRRFVVKADRSHLHKGGPVTSLTRAGKRTGARNNQGRLTTRHKGGGHKHNYRVVDFRRNKDGVPGKVERLEYDPNRSAHLALVLYADGERRYILAPKGVSAGDPVMSGTEAPIRPGSALPIRNIPIGSQIHNVELKPGRGGQIARSAGSSVQLTPRPAEGWQFSSWTGDVPAGHDQDDPLAIVMDQDRSLTAVFTEISTTPGTAPCCASSAGWVLALAAVGLVVRGPRRRRR